MCASKLMLCRAHTGWSWVKCSLVAEVAVIRSRGSFSCSRRGQDCFSQRTKSFLKDKFQWSLYFKAARFHQRLNLLQISDISLVSWFLSLQFWWKGLIKERKRDWKWYLINKSTEQDFLSQKSAKTRKTLEWITKIKFGTKYEMVMLSQNPNSVLK